MSLSRWRGCWLSASSALLVPTSFGGWTGQQMDWFSKLKHGVMSEMPALQVQLFQESGPVFTAVKPSGSVSVLGMRKPLEKRSSDRFFSAPSRLSLRLSIQWRLPLLGDSKVHQEDRDLGASVFG